MAMLFCNSLLAQQNMALVSFNGFQYKDSVILNFTMAKGYSCNGIYIERSEDSVNFSGIGDIQGVCGSSDFEVPFQFTDNSPLQNTGNFYRLDLGNFGYSEIIKIYFAKLNPAGLAFYPNPCIQNCSLYFENPTNSELEFFIYDYSGKLIVQEKIRGTVFEIDRKNLSRGVYYYHLIHKDEIKISGRFVVL